MLSSRIIILPILEELKEFLGPSFLEQTHQRTLDRFHFGTGDLGDSPIAVDKASGDLLELKITSNIGVNKDLRKLSRCDDEFRDKVNSIVTVTTELRRSLLSRTEMAV